MSKFDQSNLDLTTETPSGPVECLGQTFESDDARREHYTELLREKLKDPEFRKIEGFPIGEDEDILALSDPPYYTACPNPWIGDFVNFHQNLKKQNSLYEIKALNADIKESKRHPLYNAHTYHTKVPHRAIMRNILHYTEPNAIIYDGFCGSGMSGVAAQLCNDENEILSLGYNIDSDGNILTKDGLKISKVGQRRAVLNDLSPSATSISDGYNSEMDSISLIESIEKILNEMKDEYGWMYKTDHGKGQFGSINYTIWSDMFSCPECLEEFVFWDDAVNLKTAEVSKTFECKWCGYDLTKNKTPRVLETIYDNRLKQTIKVAKQIPVLISYKIGNKSFEKKPDESDFLLIKKIQDEENKCMFPVNEIPDGFNTRQPKRSHGFSHVHHFYTKRSLLLLSSFFDKCKTKAERFLFTGLLSRATKLNQLHLKNYVFGGGGCNAGHRKGTLYAPSISMETSIIDLIESRLKTQVRAIDSARLIGGNILSTGSATNGHLLSDNSIDYAFIDPPFGSNINYSELSFFWEAWLGVFTNNEEEAIENKIQKKGPDEYKDLMVKAFKEVFRILKPGRWITVEFSNTKAYVWNTLLAVLKESGFIISSVSDLNKMQGGMAAIRGKTAVLKDLIINAYKPEVQLELTLREKETLPRDVWKFIDRHLLKLEVVSVSREKLHFIEQRDPRNLYDSLITFYFSRGMQVPLSASEFQIQLCEKYPQRDGMFFLPEEVIEYDKASTKAEGFGQLEIFVEDEKSATNWLRQELMKKPSTYQEILPDFMHQLSASWKVFESRPELIDLLEQYFIKYEKVGPVPSQITNYLSKNFHKFRGKAKDDPTLQAMAEDRWYVPDPKKMADVEAQREKKLLSEFWDYASIAGIERKKVQHYQKNLQFISNSKLGTKKQKLSKVRSEAVVAGFRFCNNQKDFSTTLAVAEILPNSLLEEDEKIIWLIDIATSRSE